MLLQSRIVLDQRGVGLLDGLVQRGLGGTHFAGEIAISRVAFHLLGKQKLRVLTPNKPSYCIKPYTKLIRLHLHLQMLRTLLHICS